MPIHLLITAGADLRRDDPEATASLGLIQGLERRGIRWTQTMPLQNKPDLDGYDAVLSWWGKPSKRRYLFEHTHVGHIYRRTPAPNRVPFEREIEERCGRMGIPVINPLSRRLGMKHSTCLRAWSGGGVPCARFQTFGALDEVTLGYPMILRVDGGSHALNDAFRVKDEAEARAVLERRAGESRLPLTLAIQFCDTRYSDGLYRKRRSYVVGGRVLPRQQMVAEGWQVKLKTSITGEPAVSENRRFREQGEEEPELVARAGGLLGPEVVALDYTRLENGSYLFWEGNSVFGMAGLGDDEKSRLYREATGFTREDCAEEHTALGEAIADLILERVERAKRGAAAGPGRAAADR